jgi:selenocysteine-specific elongation factor
MRRTVTLGTAGHIDHGKTALVRALTGVDTDRLPEEKRRGITIDLGFAHLDLQDDLRIAIIDVPGHEAFVRNMTAGATGIDLGLLVIAADEGIMPQTREHVAILELLGVPAAAIALTKCDLVEPEWIDLVTEEITAALRATSFQAAPIVRVSAATGQGLDELQAVLENAARAVSIRSVDDLFRLPIDRVFTVRGTGTVVTGTVWSGQAHVDEIARLLPSGRRARIRALQRQGEPADRVLAGERAAVALIGVAHNDVSRGETLVTHDAWVAATRFTAHVRVLDDVVWSVAPRRPVHVHVGTAAVLARLQPISAKEIGPGEEGWVLVRLQTPLVMRAGDRFILRSFSPVTTVAGGTVFEWSDQPYRRKPAQLAQLESLRSHQPREQLEALTLLRAWGGLTADQVGLHARGQLDLSDFPIAGGSVFHPDIFHLTVAGMLEGLIALHEASPLLSAIELQAFRRTGPPGASPAMREAAVRHLVDQRKIEIGGAGVRLAGWVPRLTGDLVDRQEALAAAIDAAGVAAIAADELPPSDQRDSLLLLLREAGRIFEIGQGCYIGRTALGQAAATVASALGQGPRSPSELRDLLGVSRKHLIPLLEYLDKLGLTGRLGGQRILARVEVVSDLQSASS